MQTCFETFGRWVPLKKGQELNILTSLHQFAKTVEIPSRFKFRFSYFLLYFKMFLLHYNISQEQRKKNSKLQIMKGKMCRVTKVLSYM